MNNFPLVRLFRALRSKAFAEGLRFLGYFFVSNLVLLALVFVAVSLRFFNEVQRDIYSEFKAITEVYRDFGVEGVDQQLRYANIDGRPNQFFYLLLNAEGERLAGTLEDAGQFIDVNQGWLGLQFNRVRGLVVGKNRDYVSSEHIFDDDNKLVLVRYIGEVRSAIFGTLDIFLSAIAISMTLSLLIVLFTSASFLRRLEPINRDIDIVMAGNLSHRLDAWGVDSEMEELVGHINEMLDRIQQLMEGVKQVSDNIAHDLRTPLTRLRNNLARYERTVEGEQREVIRELIAESDGLIKTFNALLRIAKIELGETRQRRELVALHALVEEVVELYEPVAHDKNIHIAMALNDSHIFADRDLIFQAIANILDNAIKYTPAEGHISVDIFRKPVRPRDEKSEAAVVRITDSGCGIREENKDKVFRRFFREDSTRAVEPGNGLGLSLVAAVAKIHNAKIQLRNCQPGLEVSIEFPAVQSRVGKYSPERSNTALSGQTQP